MEKHRKCALALMELGDSIIEKKRRRVSIIRRAAFSVSGLCAVILIGVGILSNSAVQTPPDRVPSDKSSIIMQETTSVAEISKATTTIASETEIQNRSTTAITLLSETVTQKNTNLRSTATTAYTATGVSLQSGEQTLNKTEITSIQSEATAILPSATTPVVTTSALPVSHDDPEPVNPEPDSAQKEYYRVIIDDNSGIKYEKLPGSVSLDVIGDSMGCQNITDSTENNEISCSAELFSIIGLFPEVMIAVKYEDKEDFTLYYSPDYIPDTLGDFISDIGLDNYADLSKAELYNFTSGYELRVYQGIDAELIKDILNSCDSSVCYRYDELLPDQVNAKMNIICDMNDLFPIRTAFGISVKGFLTTNITGRGLAFYIGEENAAYLIEQVVDNYPYEVQKMNDDET